MSSPTDALEASPCRACHSANGLASSRETEAARITSDRAHHFLSLAGHRARRVESARWRPRPLLPRDAVQARVSTSDPRRCWSGRRSSSPMRSRRGARAAPGRRRRRRRRGASRVDGRRRAARPRSPRRRTTARAHRVVAERDGLGRRGASITYALCDIAACTLTGDGYGRVRLHPDDVDELERGEALARGRRRSSRSRTRTSTRSRRTRTTTRTTASTARSATCSTPAGSGRASTGLHLALFGTNTLVDVSDLSTETCSESYGAGRQARVLGTSRTTTTSRRESSRARARSHTATREVRVPRIALALPLPPPPQVRARHFARHAARAPSSGSV